MKYDLTTFSAEVKAYCKELITIPGKNLVIIMPVKNEKAFYSIAPLSRAAHELKKDVNIMGLREDSKIYTILKDVWAAYERKDSTLMNFIKEVEKKTEEDFEALFIKPIEIIATKKGFVIDKKVLPYRTGWVQKREYDKLKKACKSIWHEVYSIKKNEKISIGFEVVKAQKDLSLPIEDILDSFFISRAMFETCQGKATMGATTSRKSMLEPMEIVSDLKTTLLGCELTKWSKEPVFRKYEEFSKRFKLNRIETSDATFFITGKGYGGKHLFGELIGYPTPGGKTRWNGPAGIIYQLDWAPQTKLDPRGPISRLGFTETLPIEVFIKTTLINYKEMRAKNMIVKKVCDASEKIIVKGETIQGYKTELVVGLVKPNGERRMVRGSDSDVKTKLDSDYYKKTKVKVGKMANIPSGEAFTTPEYIEGTFIGDVVISIDQSYMINPKEPMIVKCTKKGYEIIKGPKKILDKFAEKKKESWERILQQEKNKSVPKEIINLKKKNFNGIGEFAINTNPKAELCNYLIVNEKIANMIHIALGSGFEPDKATEYHTDIVIDAPRQKLDIYGVDKKGTKRWILKKGKFAV